MVYLYGILLLSLSLYSYASMDPNFTLVNSPYWTSFRETMVTFGYYHRGISWLLYLIAILLLFGFHFYFVKYHTKVRLIYIVIAVGVGLFFSYPFLSHDFFNYLFDAKIVTVYHQNPYLYKALDFPQDEWLRFMHWTHRTYPYGPVFLLLSLIPSSLGAGKLILNFFFFKLLYLFFFIIAIYSIQKMNKKWAIFFATQPLILIEGLVSLHNDFIALCLGVIGIYYLHEKKNLFGRILLILSGGIKYITIPFIFWLHKIRSINYAVIASIVIILGYLSFFYEVQPWYFLALFILLPWYERFLFQMHIFFAGLLFSYYPYIRLGGWDSFDKINLKHTIIVIFLIANILLFFANMLLFKQRRKLSTL